MDGLFDLKQADKMALLVSSVQEILPALCSDRSDRALFWCDVFRLSFGVSGARVLANAGAYGLGHGKTNCLIRRHSPVSSRFHSSTWFQILNFDLDQDVEHRAQ